MSENENYFVVMAIFANTIAAGAFDGRKDWDMASKEIKLGSFATTGVILINKTSPGQ